MSGITFLTTAEEKMLERRARGKAWLTYREDDTEIDIESGSVHIRLDAEGNRYLEIPIADWLHVAESIKQSQKDATN